MVKIPINKLRQLADRANGEINKIYLHWTAGRYDQQFSDYHINIDGYGNIYVDGDLTDIKAHTWHRNTGAIGIALDACYGATTDDLGDYSPTDTQIEAMAQVIAVLCARLGIDVTVDNVMTHAEAADLDDYGPATTCERWDLWLLHNGDEPGTGGGIIRGKAIFYQQQGVA